MFLRIIASVLLLTSFGVAQNPMFFGLNAPASAAASTILPTPPSSAMNYTNLQVNSGDNSTWGQCQGTCATNQTSCPGGDGCGSAIQTYGNSSIALSGASMEVGSVGEYYNVLAYRHIPCQIVPTGGTTTTGTTTVTLSTPVVSGNNVTVNATGSDTSYAIVTIQVYLDNTEVYNSGTSGAISYTLSGLSAGTHNIGVKAWNSNNQNSLYSTSYAVGPNCASVSNFETDFWFYIPSSSTTLQGVEFDPDLFGLTYKYLLSHQCVIAGSGAKDWRLWSMTAGANGSWEDSGIPCSIATNTWHHFQFYGTIDQTGHMCTYEDFVFDGTTVYQNLGTQYAAKAFVSSPAFVNIQMQVDNSVSAGTNVVYYDNYNMWVW